MGNNILLFYIIGPTDEITNLEYTRKNNREKGPALVGVKVKKP